MARITNRLDPVQSTTSSENGVIVASDSNPLAVHILFHVYENQDGGEEMKIIGTYSTEENAHKAASVFKNKPGFSKTPDGFIIDRYELDKDHWVDGF